MTLSNDIISIEVNEHGAELVSIKKGGFLSGSPAFFLFSFWLRDCEFFFNARQYNPNKNVIFAKRNSFHKNAIIAKILNA